MATTLSKYLKLKLDSNLTANATYNLQRIDALGATFQTTSTSDVGIRSAGDITIEPNSPDLEGSGIGGILNAGSSAHILDEVNLYASSTSLSGSLGLLDQASSGTKYLRLRYKSDLNGSVDTTADRTLSIDMEGQDRSMVLGGNYSQLGGNLSLTLAGNTSWSVPANSLGFLQNDGSGNLSWASSGTYQSTHDTWTSGTTKSVTHGFGTFLVMVQVLDAGNGYQNVDVDIQRPDTNTVQLTSTEAPSNWVVLISAVA